MNRFALILLVALAATGNLDAQKTEEPSNEALDSLYIAEVEGKQDRPKILHAEPLYIDLIRDLGARRGEKEWNIGLGLADNNRYDKYEALIEYEWAPVDRLGFEIELPFSFYYPVPGNSDVPRDSIPRSRLNSL